MPRRSSSSRAFATSRIRRRCYYNLGKLYSDPGQLGARAEGIRGGASHRALVPGGDGRAGLRARGAWRRRGRAWRTIRKRSPSTTSARARFAPPHVNLSAYYNRTGDPEQSAGARPPARSRSIPSPTARCFRKGAPTSGRASLERGRHGAEPGHRVQPARVVVLLRPRRRLSPAWPDGREPEGAGGVPEARA